MSLSQCCFDIHQQLKQLNPAIKRTQVYELIASKLGYKTYKYLCEDSIILCHADNLDLPSPYQSKLENRYDELKMALPFEIVDKIVSKHLKQYAVKTATQADLLKLLIANQIDDGSFETLLQNPVFKYLDKQLLLPDPPLALVILILITLHHYRPKYYQASDYLLKKYEAGEDISKSPFYQDVMKYFEDKIFQQKLIEIFDYLTQYFDESETAPYLAIFGRLINKQFAQIVFSDERDIRQNIEIHCKSNELSHQDKIQSYAWYYFAQVLGYDKILEGEPHRAYAVNSTGETITEDWEFGDFDGIVETGYDAIELPSVSQAIQQQAKQLSQRWLVTRESFYETLKAFKNLLSAVQIDGEGWFYEEEELEDNFWYLDDLYEAQYEYDNDE